MSEPISLFQEFKKGGYETCVLTSFNIDFPFYEDVLLRRMRSAGIDHHILLVDEGMCLQAMAERPPQMAGQHYSLAPMRCGGAFHPKLLLLVGKNKGFLAVGSHNVTISGYGQNLEITNVCRFDAKRPETLPVFLKAFRACQTWMADYGENIPNEVADSLAKVTKLCPWLDEEELPQSEDVKLLFTSSSTPSLWGQLSPLLPSNPRVIKGLSAFFDSKLAFVNKINELGASEFYLGVQPSLVKAPQSLANVTGCRLVDSSAIGSSSNYIHAKLMQMEFDDQELLVSGSANWSAPAWLVSGSSGNAEAVLVRTDADVSEAVNELGLNKLKDEPKLESLPFVESLDSTTEKNSIKMLVLAYDEDGSIRIPLGDWSKDVSAFYVGDYGYKNKLNCTYGNDCIALKQEEIRPGEVITLCLGVETVARVVLHNVSEIRRQSATGQERKIRQALGSLNTENPEIELLFKCIDQLSAREQSGEKKLVTKRVETGKEINEKVPSTLVRSIEDRRLDKASGRLRLAASGDIGMIMDVLIHSMKVGADNASRGLNEDKYGRNEEEQVGADDGVVDAQEQVVTEEVIAELCAKKFHSTLNKLKGYLEGAGKGGIHAALGVAAISQQLWNQSSDNRFLTTELLGSLFEILCKHFLEDTDGVYQNGESEDIFSSDDWGRLLGYIAWLAFYAGIDWRERLPLSASDDEKNQWRWANACWLYLAQRLIRDDLARESATTWVYQDTHSSDFIRRWFGALCEFGAKFDKSANIMDNLGFDLAKHPTEMFSGYRLVVSTKPHVNLASICSPGEYGKFGIGYLDILNMGENV